MNEQKRKEPEVGKIIRSLRVEEKLSLRELSQLSGLSVNAISKIEMGESSPTVASLHKLAAGLQVPITDFFIHDIRTNAVFVKSNDTTVLHSNGLTIESLGSGLPHQQLEPYKMIVSIGKDKISEPVAHSGEEFIYCLSGKIKFFIGDESFIMEPGDQLLFKANRPHSWRNMGDEPAEVLLIIETNQNEPLPHKIH